MTKSFSSLRLDDSQSLYLLGHRSSATPFFQPYRKLMVMCEKEGEFLSYETSPEWLACYEHDAQTMQSKLPLLVFRPHTVANIAPFLQACHQLDLAVTVRCGGTGLVGSCVPATEGIVLLTGHLKQLKSYDADKGTIYLEPGVTVNLLNRYVEADQWIFPLAMATNGIAGIAGCLSCQARGYHQQQQTLFDAIDLVTLVDGYGQILEVPSSVVCGSEGLWGVIIEMKVQLRRKPPCSHELTYKGSWSEILTKLNDLRLLQCLAFVEWSHEQFYLGLEGEAWRLSHAADFLVQTLPGIKPLIRRERQSRKPFLPSQKPFVMVSSVFSSSQLSEACQWSLEEAKHLQLECIQHADVLAGSLQIILQAKESPYSFTQKIEQFLVLWTDFVDRQQGVLASCHGVGLQMRPYMTPFWTEETQQFWRKWQMTFDPKGLFNQERFFPPFGKSLEKVGREQWK